MIVFAPSRRAARQVGIPHYVLNYEDAFKTRVVDRFAAEYAAGRTPSPCVLCNTEIKFGRLLDEASALGAEAIATGHYARIVETPSGLRLARATDREKDQSYFLFELNQAQLARTRFPLGTMTKTDVRRMLREAGVSIHEKPESQEICFVGEGGYSAFLQKHYQIGPSTGRVMGPDGEVLGEHQGVHNYTVGQRRGLGISGPQPYYVTSVDAASGEVRVGFKHDTMRRRFIVGSVSWTGGEPRHGEHDVQIRSRHSAARAAVRPIDGARAEVEFVEPQGAITPGQAAVFYAGEIIEGGGWIDSIN